MADLAYLDFTGGLNYQDTELIKGSNTKKIYWDKESYNFRPFKKYGVTRMNGNVDILEGDNDKGIVAIGKCDAATGEYCCVVDDEGNFKEVNIAGSLGSALVSGLNTAKGVFTDVNNKLLYSNGVDDHFYYEKGRTTTTTGTVTINGTVNVVGAGTLFVSELAVGDVIIVNSQSRQIVSITDNTHLAVDIAFTGSLGGLALTRTNISYLRASRTIGSTNYVIRSKVILNHVSRLFCAVGNILFFSGLLLYNDWSSDGDDESAGYIPIESDILSLSEYRGYLLLGLRNGKTLMLNASSSSFLNWYFEKPNPIDRATKSQESIISVDNNQYFFDKAIYTVSVGSLNQIVLSADRSANINNEENGFIDGDCDFSRDNEVFSLHNTKRKEIWFFIPILGQANFTTIYIYDYENKQWYKRVLPQEITCGVVIGEDIYLGGINGEILKDDIGETFNGEAITAKFYTQFLNFGEPVKTKDIDESYLLLDGLIGNNFNLGYRFDYDTLNFSEFNKIDLRNENNNLIWGFGNWGEKNWAITYDSIIWNYIYNGNRAIQLCFHLNEIAENIAINGIKFTGVIADAV